jgi:hypothetical protein
MHERLQNKFASAVQVASPSWWMMQRMRKMRMLMIWKWAKICDLWKPLKTSSVKITSMQRSKMVTEFSWLIFTLRGGNMLCGQQVLYPNGWWKCKGNPKVPSFLFYFMDS